MVDDFNKHRQKAGSNTVQLAGKPLGVDSTYKPKRVSEGFPKGRRYRDRNGKIQDVKVRYLQDETGDIGSVEWAKIAALAPEKLRDVQAALVQAGLLAPKSYVPGQIDAGTTKAALRDLLGLSNTYGMRWGDYLDQRVKESEAAGFDPNASSSQRAPLTLQLSNPDTIKAQVGNDATSLLGSSLAAGDPQHYVDTIHAQETAQQTDAYNQAGGAGGTTTDPASVDALLIKEHPTEYKVNQLGQHGQQFLDTLTRSLPGGMAG